MKHIFYDPTDDDDNGVQDNPDFCDILFYQRNGILELNKDRLCFELCHKATGINIVNQELLTRKPFSRFLSKIG